VKKRTVWKLVLLSGFALACYVAARGLTGPPLPATSTATVDAMRISAANPEEWLTHGLSYDEQRFSRLVQVNRQTAGKLGLAWWAELDTDRGQEGTPLVADGVIYTTTAWSKAYAFDARTGRELWRFDPKVPGQAAGFACCDVVNRGPALWMGRLYLGTVDGRLVALDAKTGRLDWQVQTTDTAQAYTITGAPRVVKGKVLIGNGGAEYGVRGYVSAYDAETGALAWRFFTTPNALGRPDNAASDKIFEEQADATWFVGAWTQTGGGGTVYDAITYDEKNDLLFIGVGNGNPWNREVRSGGKGDNLFLASIVALRPDTGEYVWHYQTVPGEMWDYTATQHIMVAELPIEGQSRRVVMQAPKNGFFYVLDAKTGKLISAEKYIPLDWAEQVDLTTGRPVEAPYARYPAGHPSRPLPGPYGGHNWQPMAFSPKTRLVYIPGQQSRGYYSQPDDPERFSFIPGGRNYGMGERRDRPPTLAPEAGPRTDMFGELIAWDPVAQTARWRLRFPRFWNSGLLATAGDIVFQSIGNQFTAFDAETGATLWRYDTVANAIGSPITYELDRTQHVALLVGNGGSGAIAGAGGTRRLGRLLVFKLGGTAKEKPYLDPVIRPTLDLTAAVASTGDIATGQKDYVQFCQPCHRNNDFLPNLSRSSVILEPEALKSIVLGGALVPYGMPSFKRYLDEGRVESLRAFFLSEAAKQSPATQAPTR
jgi:quinohemoprotein ethanol dehydrogenase